MKYKPKWGRPPKDVRIKKKEETPEKKWARILRQVKELNSLHIKK